MTIVLTTGCPDSGWDVALPVLQEAGLELLHDESNRWHDAVFQNIDSSGLYNHEEPIIPTQALVDRITTLLTERYSENLLLADSRSLWLLDFWANQFPDIVFILFFTSPRAALSHALQGSLNPLQSLHNWQRDNRQLIHFQSHHRRQALLLNAEAAAQNPEALLDKTQHLGIELISGNLNPAIQLNYDLRPLDHLLVANLANDKSLQELYLELEARAHPLGDSSITLNHSPDQLYQYYLEQMAAQQQNQTQLQQVTRAKEEQIKLAQERAVQIEQLNQARDAQMKLVEERQAELDSLTAELGNKKELEVIKKEAEEENELLLLQLHQVQEELETYFLKFQELEQRNEVDIKERDHKYQELQYRMEHELNDLEKQYITRVQQLEYELDQRNYKINELIQEGQQALEEYSYKYEQLLQQTEADLNASASIINAHVQYTSLLKNNLCRTFASPARSLSLYFKRRKKPKILRDKIYLLLKSGLFDQEWYLTHNPDVAIAGFDPAEHYLQYGAAEGRNPSDLFNTSYYLNQYPDVADSGMNPLLHYMEYGIQEGRQVLDN